MRVRAYHLILSAYGFWLPNDPRGSWSEFVRAWELFRVAGGATKVHTRRSVAARSHDHSQRLAAKRAMARQPATFTGVQARSIAHGFASHVRTPSTMIHACAIMPDHVHLVIARSNNTIEQTANLLKGAATRQLMADDLHPFAGQIYNNGKLPTPWARKQWTCYLFDDHDITRAIRYVNDNPIRAGLRQQMWKFVTPWSG